jgi:hypothetical protein
MDIAFQMAKMPKKAGTLQVEGIDYRWSVYHQPCWDTVRGALGLALLFAPMERSRRVLIVEFTVRSGFVHRCMLSHERIRVPDCRLIECVQNAISAGYDPDSRGKPFRFEAGPMKPN